MQLLCAEKNSQFAKKLRLGGSTTTEPVSGQVVSKQPFCEMYICILFDVVSKRWAFVKIWWLDYYRAGKWVGTLEK